MSPSAAPLMTGEPLPRTQYCFVQVRHHIQCYPGGCCCRLLLLACAPDAGRAATPHNRRRRAWQRASVTHVWLLRGETRDGGRELGKPDKARDALQYRRSASGRARYNSRAKRELNNERGKPTDRPTDRPTDPSWSRERMAMTHDSSSDVSFTTSMRHDDHGMVHSPLRTRATCRGPSSFALPLWVFRGSCSFILLLTHTHAFACVCACVCVCARACTHCFAPAVGTLLPKACPRATTE